MRSIVLGAIVAAGFLVARCRRKRPRRMSRPSGKPRRTSVPSARCAAGARGGDGAAIAGAGVAGETTVSSTSP